MRTLALSGWGQPHDALAIVAPDADHKDYAHASTVNAALETISYTSYGYAIGWSLGGQLLVRAIASGKLKPKRLVLIGTPFQFVETSTLKLGMKRDAFEKFRENYRRNPARTMDKAHALVHNGDSRMLAVKAHMDAQDKEAVLAYDWGNWLHLLDGFSCESLDFSGFPPTLLIYGETDAVVSHSQAQYFLRAIPQSSLLSFPGCGHAPHWHDSEAVRKAIREHNDV